MSRDSFIISVWLDIIAMCAGHGKPRLVKILGQIGLSRKFQAETCAARKSCSKVPKEMVKYHHELTNCGVC